MNCIVYNCENTGKGRTFFLVEFDGTLKQRFICNECWYSLVEPSSVKPENSQVFKNMNPITQQIRDIRVIIQGILDDVSLTDEDKYDQIFSNNISMRVYRLIQLDYDCYDQDTSYDEDVQAFVNAIDEWLKNNG